jgi:hypothetical protein
LQILVTVYTELHRACLGGNTNTSRGEGYVFFGKRGGGKTKYVLKLKKYATFKTVPVLKLV